MRTRLVYIAIGSLALGLMWLPEIKATEVVDSEHYAAINSAPIDAQGPQYYTTTYMGPATFQRSASAFGVDLSTEASTTGISLITLSEHPGRIFVDTGAFHCKSSMGTAPTNTTSQGVASSKLKRTGRWYFQALKPPLQGTSGTFELRFRLSSHYRLERAVQNGNPRGTINLYVTHNGARSTLLDMQPGLTGTTSLAESASTQIIPTLRLPFVFGQTYNINWWTDTGASVGLAGRSTSETTSVCELFDCLVFNNSGQQLVRFTDYEWYVESSALNNTTQAMPMATARMIAPSAAILRGPDGSIRVNYTGILQRSVNLAQWNDIVPQPPSVYLVSPIHEQSGVFFRARAPE